MNTIKGVLLFALLLSLTACTLGQTACVEDNYCTIDEKVRGNCHDCLPEFEAEYVRTYVYQDTEDGSMDLQATACVKNTGGDYSDQVDVFWSLLDAESQYEVYPEESESVYFNANDVEADLDLNADKGRLNTNFDIQLASDSESRCFYKTFEDVNVAGAYKVTFFINRYGSVAEKDGNYNNVVSEDFAYTKQPKYSGTLIEEDISPRSMFLGSYSETSSSVVSEDYADYYSAHYGIYDLSNTSNVSYSTYVSVNKYESQEQALRRMSEQYSSFSNSPKYYTIGSVEKDDDGNVVSMQVLYNYSSSYGVNSYQSSSLYTIWVSGSSMLWVTTATKYIQVSKTVTRNEPADIGATMEVVYAYMELYPIMQDGSVTFSAKIEEYSDYAQVRLIRNTNNPIWIGEGSRIRLSPVLENAESVSQQLSDEQVDQFNRNNLVDVTVPVNSLQYSGANLCENGVTVALLDEQENVLAEQQIDVVCSLIWVGQEPVTVFVEGKPFVLRIDGANSEDQQTATLIINGESLSIKENEGSGGYGLSVYVDDLQIQNTPPYDVRAYLQLSLQPAAEEEDQFNQRVEQLLMGQAMQDPIFGIETKFIGNENFLEEDNYGMFMLRQSGSAIMLSKAVDEKEVRFDLFRAGKDGQLDIDADVAINRTTVYEDQIFSPDGINFFKVDNIDGNAIGNSEDNEVDLTNLSENSRTIYRAGDWVGNLRIKQISATNIIFDNPTNSTFVAGTGFFTINEMNGNVTGLVFSRSRYGVKDGLYLSIYYDEYEDNFAINKSATWTSNGVFCQEGGDNYLKVCLYDTGVLYGYYKSSSEPLELLVFFPKVEQTMAPGNKGDVTYFTAMINNGEAYPRMYELLNFKSPHYKNYKYEGQTYSSHISVGDGYAYLRNLQAPRINWSLNEYGFLPFIDFDSYPGDTEAYLVNVTFDSGAVTPKLSSPLYLFDKEYYLSLDQYELTLFKGKFTMDLDINDPAQFVLNGKTYTIELTGVNNEVNPIALYLSVNGKEDKFEAGLLRRLNGVDIVVLDATMSTNPDRASALVLIDAQSFAIDAKQDESCSTRASFKTVDFSRENVEGILGCARTSGGKLNGVTYIFQPAEGEFMNVYDIKSNGGGSSGSSSKTSQENSIMQLLS